MIRLPSVTFCMLALSACASAGRGGARTSAVVEGDWHFAVDVGTSVTRGALALAATDSGYRGSLTTSVGNNVLPVRSFTKTGQKVKLVVESPNGLVIFEGTLAADSREMRGEVTYHTGQRFPMFVTRTP
jgi:hypothetical protein